MSTVAAGEAASDPVLHPLIQRLLAEFRYVNASVESFASIVDAPGHVLLFFTEDPARYRETLDLAVILPELERAFAGRFKAAVILPEAARALAPRYGFRRWPAFVMLRDGQYVGAIDGVRDWDAYVTEVARLLAAEPTRPPSIGIAVKATGEGDAPACA